MTLAEQLAKAVDEQIRAIMRNREAYIRAFVAETGLRPSECELVEQRNGDGSVSVYVRRREAAKGGE